MNNFIKTIMEKDLKEGKVDEIITRFPPEPSFYLHLGHIRAIVMNFMLAKEFGGKTNLRFDDTNPLKEDNIYIDSIIEDIDWLGFKPDNIFYGSDYFEQTYQIAINLIKRGIAYVCDLTADELNETRGTYTEPGVESIYRNRTIIENLNLFKRMRAGEFEEGSKTLRVKMDMLNPNINLRDPVIYRIIKSNHPRQNDKWCIYPMYDFAHPIQDAIEGITHSLCSLEFDNHRSLYDYFVDNSNLSFKPHQYEFGRLNIENTLMSKRYLKKLVDENLVDGYDDPRLPTIKGLKRRGYTKDSLINFVLSLGLSRSHLTVNIELLNEYLRQDLKLKVCRYNGIVNPLLVEITNFRENHFEDFEVFNNQENELLGKRKVRFGKYLYIEQDDFTTSTDLTDWKRLAKGLEVRLMNGFFIKCENYDIDKNGKVVKLYCKYDKKTKSGTGFNKRNPNGTINYLSKIDAIPAKFNIINDLLVDGEFNDDSLIVKYGFVENCLLNLNYLDKVNFIRNGYYSVDKERDILTFNKICSQKNSYKKKK